MDPIRTLRRSSGLFKNLLLALCSTLVALALAEAILRVLLPIAYSMELEHVADGHLGARLVPDRTYTLKSGGTCSVNNMGFRGKRPVSYEKAPSVVRIVALGGSSTFCYQTDDDAIWTAVLEKKLTRRYGPRVEVVNAAVPGYSVFESKIDYLYQIRPLDPDVVIVYHTWNDMKYFHLLDRGIHPKKGTPQKNTLKSVLRNFQLAWRVRSYLHDVVLPRRRENAYGQARGERVPIKDGGPAHRWERQNYDDLAMMLGEDGVLPVFASQAGLLSSENVDDPEVRAVVYVEYQNLTFEETLRQWHRISGIVKASAESHGALFVDVHEGVPHAGEYFMDHVHLTEAGNALVARIFFEGLVGHPAFDELFREDQVR